MNRVLITIGQQCHTLSFEPDRETTIKDLIDMHQLPLASACGGTGKCGLCMVQLSPATASAPSIREQELLSQDEINNGYRLACQSRAKREMHLTIVNDSDRGVSA